MEKVERESSSKPIDLGKYPPLYLVDRWDYFIKRFAKEGRTERIEYKVSFVVCWTCSWRAEPFQSRVHDNCTHGVEVIGEAGRLRGAGLIFIEVVTDLLDPGLGIVKLLLSGNSKLVFPPAPSPVFLASSNTSRPQRGGGNILRLRRINPGSREIGYKQPGYARNAERADRNTWKMAMLFCRVLVARWSSRSRQFSLVPPRELTREYFLERGKDERRNLIEG